MGKKKNTYKKKSGSKQAANSDAGQTSSGKKSGNKENIRVPPKESDVLDGVSSSGNEKGPNPLYARGCSSALVTDDLTPENKLSSEKIQDRETIPDVKRGNQDGNGIEGNRVETKASTDTPKAVILADTPGSTDKKLADTPKVTPEKAPVLAASQGSKGSGDNPFAALQKTPVIVDTPESMKTPSDTPKLCLEKNSVLKQEPFFGTPDTLGSKGTNTPFDTPDTLGSKGMKTPSDTPVLTNTPGSKGSSDSVRDGNNNTPDFPVKEGKQMKDSKASPASAPAPPQLNPTKPQSLNPRLGQTVNLMKYPKHPLEHDWTFWYFDAGKHTKWEDNLIKLSDFSFVEDFWGIVHHIVPTNEGRTNTDFSVFKKGVEPMWEDRANRDGGRWIVKIETANRDSGRTHDAWMDLLLMMIGNNVDCQKLTGVVFNVRKQCDKMSVWLSTSSSSDKNYIMEVGMAFKKILQGKCYLPIKFESHKDTQGKTGSVCKSMFSIDMGGGGGHRGSHNYGNRRNY